jgi:HPt (histidine-containing phosphotransfer) domain-containing protein
MGQAIAAFDVRELYRGAHSLKAGSAMLGAPHLTYLCQQLEESLSGRQSLSEVTWDIHQHLLRIEAEYDQVEKALRAERQRCQHEELLPYDR